MRILLPSLQRALEAKRQNIILKFRINCAIVEIQQSKSYHKWLESRLQLLVKVEKRYCGIRKGLMKVIIFYHATCIYCSGLLLQGVDRIWRKSSIFSLTSRLTHGGYLLQRLQYSIKSKQTRCIKNSNLRKEVGITIKSKEISSQFESVRNSYVAIMHQPVTICSTM